MPDFDPAKYLAEKTGAVPQSAPAFDPAQYLAEKTGSAPAPSTPEVPYWESALRGVNQGLTLGFADELVGATGALGDAAKKMTLSDLVKDYVKNRDEYRARDKVAKEANPNTFGGANLTGGVAGMFVPAGAAVKGGSALLNAGKIAAMGAAQGLGSSEADLTQGDVGNATKDAALGAGAGLVGYGAGNLASRLIPTAVGSGNLAVRKAIEHLRPTPKVARVLGPDRLSEIGREALDSGAIQFGAKAGDTAEALAAQREGIGQEIGHYIDEAGAAGKTVNVNDVADKFQKQVIDPLKGQAANKKIVENLEKQKEDFLIHYGAKADPAASEAAGEMASNVPQNNPDASLTPLQIEEEKRAVQGNINYLTDPKAAQSAQMGYANVLKNAGEEAIDNPAFNEAKAKFGKVADAQMMAERTAGLTDSGTGMFNKLHDLSAEQIAAHALMHGEPMTAAAVAGGRALVRGRSASAIAVGADKASKFLQANPLLNSAAQGAESLVQKGAPVAARQADIYTKNNPTTPPLDAPTITSKLRENPEASKFIGAINSAASRGQESLAATHFLLSQTQPEYQKAFQQ